MVLLLKDYARFNSLAITTLGGVIFLLAAMCNGFPFFYSDSISYLYVAKYFESLGARPIFYGLLLGLFRQFSPSTWVALFFQSFLTAMLIRWVLDVHHCKRANVVALAIYLALALFTGISWQVGQLMADVFTPLAFLSFYLLVFRRRELTSFRQKGSSVIFLFSLLVHYSHWTIMLGGLAGLFVCVPPVRRMLRAQPPWLAINLILATLPLTLVVNQMLGFDFLYSKNQYAFLTSRLLEDRSLSAFLEKNCDKQNYIFCDQRELIKHQSVVDFLWGWSTPFKNQTNESARYRELLTAIFLDDPLGQGASAMAVFGKQLIQFQSGEGLYPYGAGSLEVETVREILPAELPRFLSSSQQSGSLQRIFGWLNPLYILVFSFSILFLGVFFWRAGHSWKKEKELAAVLVCLGLSNAFVCGVFSGAYHRYESRVAWLPVFVVLVILAKKILFSEPRRNNPPLEQIE